MYLFRLVFWFVLLYTYPIFHYRVGLLGHIIFLFLVFKETSILFSTVGASIYIPPDSTQGFPFLHIPTNICYLCSFQ